MIEKDVVAEWISDQGYTVEEQPPPDGTEWQLRVQYPSEETHIDLIGEGEDCLHVQRTVNVTDEHQEKLRTLSDDQIAEFRFNLVRDLLLKDLRFGLEEDETGQLVVVGVSAKVWESEFTKNKLWSAINNVLHGSWLQVVHIRRAVGEKV